MIRKVILREGLGRSPGSGAEVPEALGMGEGSRDQRGGDQVMGLGQGEGRPCVALTGLPWGPSEAVFGVRKPCVFSALAFLFLLRRIEKTSPHSPAEG